MFKTTPRATEIEGQDKEDPVQNEDPVETRKQEQMERDEQIDKVTSPPHEMQQTPVTLCRGKPSFPSCILPSSNLTPCSKLILGFIMN